MAACISQFRLLQAKKLLGTGVLQEAPLIGDFFDEVERVLKERGIPFEAVEEKEGDRP